MVTPCKEVGNCVVYCDEGLTSETSVSNLFIRCTNYINFTTVSLETPTQSTLVQTLVFTLFISTQSSPSLSLNLTPRYLKFISTYSLPLAKLNLKAVEVYLYIVFPYPFSKLRSMQLKPYISTLSSYTISLNLTRRYNVLEILHSLPQLLMGCM